MPKPAAIPCVLSLDIGTSSVRVLGYDTHGRLIPDVAASEEHAPDITPDGGSTMDPDAVLERAFRCLDGALAKARELRHEVLGVAACTFWHSVLPLDGSGRPLGPLLMWSDTRSAAQAEGLKFVLDEHAVHGRTGCVLHPSYVPAKMAWVRKSQPQLVGARWVSIGEYLGLRTHGRLACSVSMASGTGLLDLRKRTWDLEVLAACGLSPDQLATLVEPSEPSVGLAREAAARWPELAKVPWYPALGDGAASNLGCGATSSSRAALMVGTSGALRWVRCEGVPIPPWGLWAYLIDSTRYLYGGALSNGGNLAAWLRDTLRIPWGAELDAELGALEPDGHGLTVLPFLAGERNPGWHGSARGTITGLSLHTTPAEISRACLEAVAYRFAAIHELLEGAGARVDEVIATGGGLLASPAWMRILADVLGCPLTPSEEPEASSRGAALMALNALGLLPSLDAATPRLGRPITPDPSHRDAYLKGRSRHEEWYGRVVRS